MAQKAEVISLGKVEEYDSNIPWNIYIEKIEFYFSANNIEDSEKKKNILLSSIGTTTFAVLRDIIVPETLKEISYAALLKKAAGHFSPCPSEIVERFKFQKRVRRPGESVADFVRDLRRLSEYCNFSDTLNERLRDQLVFGIQENRIQQKLLDTKNLTFQTAIEIAQSFESAEAGVKSLCIKELENVNKVGTVRRESKAEAKPKEQPNFAAGKGDVFKKKDCYRCSKAHDPKFCPFKSAVCHLCKRIGHLKICCRSRKFYTSNNMQKKTGKVKTVQEYSLNFMSDKSKGILLNKTVKINHFYIDFEINSGASHTILNKRSAEKLFLKHRISIAEKQLI